MIELISEAIVHEIIHGLGPKELTEQQVTVTARKLTGVSFYEGLAS